jgi:hypothetical protein
MFWKKKEDTGEETVPCAECGVMVCKEKAYEYKVEMRGVWALGDTYVYSCDRHKKPYDLLMLFSNKPCKYFKSFEVSEDGTPIGYKKIK